VAAAILIVSEFPEMHDLVDVTGVRLKVPEQFLVMACPPHGRISKFREELFRLGHLSDVQRVGPHFVKWHLIPHCGN
jgi:hypothetical protein